MQGYEKLYTGGWGVGGGGGGLLKIKKKFPNLKFFIFCSEKLETDPDSKNWDRKTARNVPDE
jgi:hypothetical protein